MEILIYILSKISSYNILNYMIPGAVGLFFIDKVLGYTTIETWPAYIICIVVYFMGLVFNRVGSVFIEPWYKCVKIVVYTPYADFVKAERKDGRLTTFSEVNNSYKTYTAESLLLFIACIVLDLLRGTNLLCDWVRLISLFALYILFSFSYHKQTAYIGKRTKSVNALVN